MNHPTRPPRDRRFLVPLLLAAFAGAVLARRPAGSACLPCGFPGALLCPAPALDGAAPTGGGPAELTRSSPISPR